jgi:hypothetical protein
MVSSVDIKNATDNTPVIKRVATASAIGTAAEYYDFFAYGTAAVLFFGHLFSPVPILLSVPWPHLPPMRWAF